MLLTKYIRVVRSEKEIIIDVFDYIGKRYRDEEWLRSRSISATTIKKIDELNDKIGLYFGIS